MKTLLITNYWYPYNHSGTMRWLQFGRYINFDVLTTKKPRGGFKDETLPKPYHRRVLGYTNNLPATFSGLCLSVTALTRRRYDVYIYSVPPFSLAVGAWILQTLGRKVVVDVRDNLDNKNNKWNLGNRFCWWIIQKIKYRTTSFQFLDSEATVIYSGYNPELYLMVEKTFWRFIKNNKRWDYKWYNEFVNVGRFPDYRKRIKGKYACSSFVNLKYLGFKNLPTDCLHEECINQPVQSWEESAEQYKKYLERL